MTSRIDRRSFLSAAGTVGVAGVLAGCSQNGGNGSGNEDTVQVGPDNSLTFEPDSLTVSTGTEVTFTWESAGHSIVVETQPEGAQWAGVEEIKDQGFEHSQTFETAGDYEYYCSPHRGQGMTGTIIVEE
jgi:plastocyanin